MNFNQNSHPEINELNKSVSLDQVFEIENTIIEPVLKIKNKSVVKIRNLMYNFYISTEIKRLDGDADEIEELDGGDDNMLVNQTEIGGGGFADDTATRTGADGTSPEVQMDELGEQALVPAGNEPAVQEENIEDVDGGGDAAEEAENEEMEEEEDEEGEEKQYHGKFAKIMVDVSDSMIFNGIKMINQASMDDVFILDKYDPNEIRANLFIQSCVPPIKEFLYISRLKANDLRGPYMKRFEDLLSQMYFFLISSENITGDPLMTDGSPNRYRQKYFRELKIIDLLVDILIYEFEGENAPFNLDKITEKSPITRICQIIYRILKLCAKDNELNKFYVAQWISHFFDQSMNT